MQKVVEPPSDRARTEEPEKRLRAFAREEGYPGLPYHSDGAKRVDLQASCAALKTSERFAVDACLQPAVEQEASVLVGIPAYNEAGSIAVVVESASEYAATVLVVDDGSDDDTAKLADEAGTTVLEDETNSGYGATLSSIFRQAHRAEVDHLVVPDADGQHDPGDIPELVRRKRESGADIVIGCRFGEEAETEMPVYRRFGLGVVNLLTNLSLGVFRPRARVRDTQSGFRAYSKSAVESFAEDSSLGDQMDASTNILYHAYSNDYDIEEVPTTIDYDVEDRSSQNPIRHGITLVWNILRTVERERPITMVGISGLLCTLVGFGFCYSALYSYVQSGSFPVAPALTAITFSMVGIFATFTAIILDSQEVYRD